MDLSVYAFRPTPSPTGRDCTERVGVSSTTGSRDCTQRVGVIMNNNNHHHHHHHDHKETCSSLFSYSHTPIVGLAMIRNEEEQEETIVCVGSTNNDMETITPTRTRRSVCRKGSTKNSNITGSCNTIASNSSSSSSRRPSCCGDDTTNDKPIMTKRRKKMKRKENGTQRHSMYGNLPDVEWRAISMEHLRLHPYFVALPESMDCINDLEDVRYFRQDSWQWDALHTGRCTTSQASAALGFLEPKAGSFLQIPRSWQRGGLGAYNRLRAEGTLRTLQDMQQYLIQEYPREEQQQQQQQQQHKPQQKQLQQRQERRVWSKPNLRMNNYPFAAKYFVRMTHEIRTIRRNHLQQRFGCTTSSTRTTKTTTKTTTTTTTTTTPDGTNASMMTTMSTKMGWGDAQEATALLTALNYFWKKDPNVRLEEVGMCGAGLYESHNLLIGASPDALIRHSNGTMEVLEVKNHCPFYSTKSWLGRKALNNHHEKKAAVLASQNDFVIKSFPFSKPYISLQYIPQMMMEMLCVGPECTSAIMVRQTAISGALIMRLQRNDDWIDEMLYWLHRFQSDFVEKEIPPPTDFFGDTNQDGDASIVDTRSQDDKSRYQLFLEHTKQLAETVQILDHVPHQKIQRQLGTERGTTSLFLD